MALLDLMGRRWSLRIIWSLRNGPMTSRALRAACNEASPTVMQRRLNELRDADLVDHLAGSGYKLTTLGEGFVGAFQPLSAFAKRWSKRRA